MRIGRGRLVAVALVARHLSGNARSAHSTARRNSSNLARHPPLADHRYGEQREVQANEGHKRDEYPVQPDRFQVGNSSSDHERREDQRRNRNALRWLQDRVSDKYRQQQNAHDRANRVGAKFSCGEEPPSVEDFMIPGAHRWPAARIATSTSVGTASTTTHASVSTQWMRVRRSPSRSS